MHFPDNLSHTVTSRLLPLVWLAALCCSLHSKAVAQTVTIASPTHPVGVFHDFSTPTIPFKPYAVAGGVASGARFEIEDGVLKITNAHAGSFGIDTNIKDFDAEKFGYIYFDYLLSPQVKVNVFFRLKGKYHGAIFSGPEHVRPGSVLLGKIADVQADGKWHRAYIPLREWLRQIYPTEDQFNIEEIIIGNWDNSGWLMAGIGGNGPGAQWRMDNFAIVGPGPNPAKFELTGTNGGPLTGKFAWAVDDNKPVPLGASTLNYATAGFHLLRITNDAGKLVAAAPFLSTVPPYGGEVKLHDNTIQVVINAPAGLDNRELKLTVGDRSFDRTSPFLSWDGDRSTLSLDAARAGFAWANGQKINVNFSGVKDILGRPIRESRAATIAVDYARHQAAPPAPQIAAVTGETGDGSFEASLDEWSSRDVGGAIVERDNTTTAGGQYSLRLTSPANATPFAAWVRRTAFDAAKYPIITFDYRVPPDLRVDFVLNFEGKPYSIRFTDSDNQRPRLGTIPNVIADNQWHRAEINLLELLRALRPGGASYPVDSLVLMDDKWLGNARGVQYWIDNFQFVPQVSGKPFRAEAQIKDVTGLKAISWIIDEQPQTVPPTIAAATTKIEYSGNGRKWLHVRAQNGAGNWGPAAHLPLLLEDKTP